MDECNLSLQSECKNCFQKTLFCMKLTHWMKMNQIENWIKLIGLPGNAHDKTDCTETVATVTSKSWQITKRQKKAHKLNFLCAVPF